MPFKIAAAALLASCPMIAAAENVPAEPVLEQGTDRDPSSVFYTIRTEELIVTRDSNGCVQLSPTPDALGLTDPEPAELLCPVGKKG